jgi:hypothetical protein
MKKKTYLFALMAMALTLGSCSDNENGIGGETSKYITVSTSIGNMTRVATDANGGQTFEEGDEISVYAWTGDATVAPETRERVVNNAINKLTNGSWISNPQMLWKNNRDKHYFIGVYPISAISDLSAGEYTFDETKQVESDIKNFVDTAKREGIEIGRAEGKHEANTETAQRLLAMGLSAEQVAKATQLPLEIIKNLSNS